MPVPPLPPGFALEDAPPSGSSPPLPDGFSLVKPTMKEKLKDPATRSRINVEGGRQYARDTLGSAKTKKSPLDRFVSGVTQAFGAQVVGAGSAAFGVGDAAIRKKFKKENPWMTDEDAKEAMLSYRDEVLKLQPLAMGTGAVAGAIGSGGAIASGAKVAGRGVAAAVPALKTAVEGVGNFARLRPGQFGANAAKLAATGLGAGAATVAISEGRAPTVEEAAIMAAAGPALKVGGDAIGAGVKSVTSRFPSFVDTAAAGEIARRIGIDIPERMAQFSRLTGRDPLIGEVLNPEEAKAISQFAAKAPGSANTFEAGSDAAEARFRDGVRQDVEQLGSSQGSNVTTRDASRALTEVMNDIRPNTVILTPSMYQMLRNNGVNGITRSDRAAMESGNVTVDLMERLRSHYSKESGVNAPGVNLLVDMVTQQHPTYGPALASYRQQFARGDGADKGASGILGSMTPDNFQASIPEGARDPVSNITSAAGFREGALDRLQGAATENPGSISNQMRLGGLRDRLARIVNPEDLDGVSASIDARGRGVDSVRAITGRGAITEDQQNVRNFSDAVTGFMGVLSPLGGAAKAGIANRVSMGIALPNRVRVRVAEMMLDPATAGEAIQALQAAGHSQQQILDLYQGMAAYAGIGNSQPEE